MLFTAQYHSADRSFELVRRSLLQDQDLPFADALTTSQIEQAFEAEGILFGVTPQNPDDASGNSPTIVYTMGVTLWAMLSQALFTDVQRACRAAVQRVAVYYALNVVMAGCRSFGKTTMMLLLSESWRQD